MDIDIVRDDTPVQLVPYMLLFAILWVYPENSFCLQKNENHLRKLLSNKQLHASKLITIFKQLVPLGHLESISAPALARVWLVRYFLLNHKSIALTPQIRQTHLHYKISE